MIPKAWFLGHDLLHWGYDISFPSKEFETVPLLFLAAAPSAVAGTITATTKKDANVLTKNLYILVLYRITVVA
jgi:hypothetical protein